MHPSFRPGDAARTRAWAPGGVGNIGPGLDILGCALNGVYDEALLEWAPVGARPGIHLLDPGHPDLPADAARHSSAIAVRAVLERAGRADAAVLLRTIKRLPLSGGQGGSAASAVAGAVAANALIGAPLDALALLDCALDAEAAVAGRHADNLAPALLGGVVLVRDIEPLDVVRLAYPRELRVVLAHPAHRLPTAEARAVLPATLDRGAAMRQAAQVAAMVAALASEDWALLRRAVDDRIAEPVRAALVPGFVQAQRAALDAGAYGCSISGAGPSVFALARGDAHAARLAQTFEASYRACGVAADVRVAQVDPRGAQVEIVPAHDRQPTPA